MCGSGCGLVCCVPSRVQRPARVSFKELAWLGHSRNRCEAVSRSESIGFRSSGSNSFCWRHLRNSAPRAGANRGPLPKWCFTRNPLNNKYFRRRLSLVLVRVPERDITRKRAIQLASRAPTRGDTRVVRGGPWIDGPRDLRGTCAADGNLHPGNAIPLALQPLRSTRPF